MNWKFQFDSNKFISQPQANCALNPNCFKQSLTNSRYFLFLHYWEWSVLLIFVANHCVLSSVLPSDYKSHCTLSSCLTVRWAWYLSLETTSKLFLFLCRWRSNIFHTCMEYGKQIKTRHTVKTNSFGIEFVYAFKCTKKKLASANKYQLLFGVSVFFFNFNLVSPVHRSSCIVMWKW